MHGVRQTVYRESIVLLIRSQRSDLGNSEFHNLENSSSDLEKNESLSKYFG